MNEQNAQAQKKYYNEIRSMPSKVISEAVYLANGDRVTYSYAQ